VDNGSTDATKTGCQPLGSTLFPRHFRLLRLPRNVNFGPACNMGAHAATGELLLLLNNDTLLSPNWLPPLVQALRDDPRCGAVGPLLVYPADAHLGVRVQHLGIVVEPQLYPRHLYEFFPAEHPLARKKRAVQTLTAAAMLLPRALFFDCGGFCEEYRNGGEDVDLGLHITQRGLAQYCVPQSVVTHLTSQTPGRNDHERHNAEVLKRRCLKLFLPDLHYHAQHDGYVLGLSPAMIPYLGLPPRRAELLHQRMASGFDAGLCREMLQREPLWQEGYGLLARFVERTGALAEACALRFLEARFWSDPQALAELHRLAVLAGDSVRAAYATARQKWHSRLDRAELLAPAREAARYMSLLQLPEVAQLYERWIAEHGGAPVQAGRAGSQGLGVS